MPSNSKAFLRNIETRISKKSVVNKATKAALAIQQAKNLMYLSARKTRECRGDLFLFKNKYWLDKFFKGKEKIPCDEVTPFQKELSSLWKEYIGSDLSREISRQVAQEFSSTFAKWKRKEKSNLPKPKKLTNTNKVSFIANKNLIIDKRLLKRGASQHLVVRLGKLGSIKIKIPEWIKISHVQVTIFLGVGVIVRIFYGIEKSFKYLNADNWLAIDIGVNNFAAAVSNVPDAQSLLIDGLPIKSFNQWFNKQLAKLQKENDKAGIRRLSAYRNRKLNTWMHQIASQIIGYAVEHDIGTLIIPTSLLEEFAAKKELSSKFNQTFRHIPFGKFLSILSYKAKLHGLRIIEVEESYTSKLSFLSDEIDNIKESSGKRKYRGLFIDKALNKAFNTDLNGAANIAKKALGEEVAKGSRTPIRVWIDKLSRPVKVNVIRESWSMVFSRIADSTPIMLNTRTSLSSV